MPPLRRPAAESTDFNPQTEGKWRRMGCNGPSRPSKIKEMTQRDAYRLKRRLDLGKPSPGKPQSAQQSQTQVFSPAVRPQVPRGDVTHCFYSNCDVIDV